MVGKLIAKLGVARRLIRHDMTFAVKVSANDWKDFGLRNFADMEGTSRTAALNEGKDGILVTRTLLNFETFFAADEALVDFDD
jgi:hypothetical protein